MRGLALHNIGARMKKKETSGFDRMTKLADREDVFDSTFSLDKKEEKNKKEEGK